MNNLLASLKRKAKKDAFKGEKNQLNNEKCI